MNDDELLAHLKATDPALTSKAPRPDVTRLVEATMNTNTNTATTTKTATATAAATTKATQGARPRRRLVPALAFTALLLVGGGVSWGVARGGEGPADKAGAGAAGVGRVPQLGPLTLMLPEGNPGTAKCVAPTPDLLRGHEMAFEGTVTAEEGDDRVILRVDHWYRLDPNLANPSDQVRLSNSGAFSEAPDFRIGVHYLVTADGGIVPMCGGTTEATDEGRAMFREAFETPVK
ncbi:hypothetical protein [Streptomyces sp. SID12501]|uniref:Uncharacterized protein n=1 Tax=Streptomyces sp. SID12501 TaxID=2706042 RepID=A0A6B3BL02_9ACTN|nr:hypothetical protein [Streptomyces sp. SID12501]NEC84702.1 hypothetical protein [Streptomyces sp. SID12501]